MANAMLVALRARIATSTGAGGFSNLFGNRVWLDAAPADTALPLCVYEVVPSEFVRCMDGTETQRLRVVFNFYEGGSDLVTAPTASDRLRTLIDGVALTATGYDRVLCILRQRGTPAFADDIWTTSDVYELVGQLQ